MVNFNFIIKYMYFISLWYYKLVSNCLGVDIYVNDGVTHLIYLLLIGDGTALLWELLVRIWHGVGSQPIAWYGITLFG